MNKIRLVLMAVAGIFALVSCTKETQCTLESLASPDGIERTYEYDAQNRISRINYYDPLNGNVLAFYFLVNRNEDGKISSVDNRYASGIAVYYYTATYNAHGDLGTVYKFENSQNDFIADELYSTTYYYHGDDEKVDSTVMYFGVNKRATTFLWTGDNVTGLSHRFNDVLQYSRTFVYDNIDNAYSNIAELNQIVNFDTGEPDKQSFSKNNNIQMSHYDAVGGLIGTYDYTFTLGSSGHIESIGSFVFLNYHCE